MNKSSPNFGKCRPTRNGPVVTGGFSQMWLFHAALLIFSSMTRVKTGENLEIAARAISNDLG